MARETATGFVTHEAGQVVTEHQADDLPQRMSSVAFAETVELNAIAEVFNELTPELARSIRAAANQQNVANVQLSDPYLPDEQKALFESLAAESGKTVVSGQVEMRVSSLLLEQELRDVLELIPPEQRAQYVAGFLRHYDLVRTENGDGTITYTQNLDQEQPHSGLYVPTALINDGPERQ